MDSPLCFERFRALGLARWQEVHICTTRHNNDQEELADTVRHELWHVVQFCNGSPITSDPINAITTAASRGWTGKGYSDPTKWHMEAEAYFIASTGDEAFIKTSLDKFCFS